VTNFFCRFGVPRELHSDQDRNCESQLLQEVVQYLGICRTCTIPLTHSGMAVEEGLKMCVSMHQTDWDKRPPFFLLASGMSIHDAHSQHLPTWCSGENCVCTATICCGLPRQGAAHCRLHHRSRGTAARHPSVYTSTLQGNQVECPPCPPSQICRIPGKIPRLHILQRNIFGEFLSILIHSSFTFRPVCLTRKPRLIYLVLCDVHELLVV
jgi:hypothetical protein